MRRRIAATRWPEPETVTDDSQGVPLAMMRDLAAYWGTGYDWRKCEARLNALPNFVTEIDAYEQLSGLYAKHVACAQIMATRPQTLYGLADSPADLAASPPYTRGTGRGRQAERRNHGKPRAPRPFRPSG